MSVWIKELESLNPCAEGVMYAKGHATLQEAWDLCDRGDWMLWLAGKLTTTEKTWKVLVLCTCECARQSLQYVPAEDKRPLAAIEIAERWARGEQVTRNEVRKSAYAYASTAAYDAYAAASYAFSITSGAAYDAYASAYASVCRHASLKLSADIVRRHYPKAPTGERCTN